MMQIYAASEMRAMMVDLELLKAKIGDLRCSVQVPCGACRAMLPGVCHIFENLISTSAPEELTAHGLVLLKSSITVGLLLRMRY